MDPMICFGGHNRIDPRVALLAGLGLALPLALNWPAQAQDKPAGVRDTLKQHQHELETLRGEQNKSAETEAALKREIERIGADRRKLNQALIDTAARLRGAEAKVAATENRLKPLDGEEPRCASRLTRGVR